MNIGLALFGVSLFGLIEVAPWVITYRRSRGTRDQRTIDANIAVITVNVGIICVGAIGNVIKAIVA